MSEKKGSELPLLTDQQLGFVEDLLAGKSASDAYRANYSAENMSQRAIWANASALKSNRKVALWLRAANLERLSKAGYGLEAHIAELDEAALVARETGNIGAMVNAIVNKGKALGLYVEQRKDVTERNPSDLVDKLAEISPELASVIAKDMGLTKETLQ